MSMPDTQAAPLHDILVAGGGPVGMALAHALQQLAAASLPAGSLRVALVGDAPLGADRPIALSWGSRLILERIGCWEGLPVTPITRIHVSQPRRFGRTLISAADHDLEALGYVVGYRDIVQRLQAGPLPLVRDHVQGWSVAPDSVTAHGAAGDLAGRLLVLADGSGNDPAGETVKDYGQSAVVCNITTETPHANTAWERFAPEGPLALLPFRDGHALVWTCRTAHAQDIVQLDDADFLAAAAQAFGGRLGRFLQAGPRAAFPLALRHRERTASARVIPVGNAAQTLHPVAGQGLNLGLRDAWELAELAVRAQAGAVHQVPALGSDAFADAFRQRRSLDRRAMMRLTDGLIGAFSLDLPLAGAARGAALALLDMLPPARRFLSRRMMFGARAFP